MSHCASYDNDFFSNYFRAAYVFLSRKCRKGNLSYSRGIFQSVKQRCTSLVHVVPPSVLCRRSSAVSIFDVFWEWFVDYHWYIWGLNTGRWDGEYPFRSCASRKTWANIVMAIQPGYRLLMRLLTASSLASDLTADQQNNSRTMDVFVQETGIFNSVPSVRLVGK